ncbi:MAG: hypothetical protein HY318_19290, partial [Armatimonadetes bacterium]|nr:hypothetical protein [Armatimonadota bacterium]
MVSRYPRLMIGLLAVASVRTAWSASPLQTVSLTNRALLLTFDLSTGTYDLVDLTSNTVALRGAHAEVGGISSGDPQLTRYGTCKALQDELGPGQKMTVECRQKNGPDLLLEFRMYTSRS